MPEAFRQKPWFFLRDSKGTGLKQLRMQGQVRSHSSRVRVAASRAHTVCAALPFARRAKPFQKPLPAPRGAPAQLQAARVARRLSAGATHTSVRGLVRGRSARCDAGAGAPGAAGHDPARHSLRRGASARPCWLPAARADGGGRDPSWSLRARFCSLFCSSTPAGHGRWLLNHRGQRRHQRQAAG